MLNLSKIQFPIYPVNISSLTKEGTYKLLFQRGRYTVLDDSSKTGNLARRRLQYEADKTVFMKRPLAKLVGPIFRYSDIFQVLKSYKTFIDSNGLIFEYTNSRFCPLVYYKIKKFIEIPTGYAIVIHGVHCKFFLNRVPKLEERYAGLLEVDEGFVLYELCENHKSTTRRKI